jgi:hypothetical protein
LDNTRPAQVVIDGEKVASPRLLSDRSWLASFRKTGLHWEPVQTPGSDTKLRKRHGLQGPIDDAFMDSFLIVRPTGQPFHERFGAWAAAELVHATNHWRQQFRGDARVKDDMSVTDEDISSNNLILWGDPGSNRWIAKLNAKLPVKWTRETVAMGEKSFPASENFPALVYPNPLNPKKYVVLNSGFTFREYDQLNNARQVPKLPDYAIVDITVPPDTRFPGKIVQAGFFNEDWGMK